MHHAQSASQLIPARAVGRREQLVEDEQVPLRSLLMNGTTARLRAGPECRE